MKQHSWTALFALLVMMQLYSLIKIGALERQLENLNYEVSSVETHLSGQLSDIYENAEQKLQQQASLILRASAQLGEPDADTLTVPVTFTVAPKTVTEDTAVSLDFDGETLPLEKFGLEYRATKNIEISQSISPTVVIETGGEKHVEAHAGLALANLREAIFPELFARISVQSSYSSNTYKQSGSLEIDYKPSQANIGFTDITYVVRVDGNPVKETPVFTGGSGLGGTFRPHVDEQYSLEDGQVLTGHVVAVDSLGFIHEYQVLHFTAGADAQREPYSKLEKITGPNGQIIYRDDE
ncbi:MAG TPA: hypothetical protein VN446_08205 [Candidatus Acidoferrum sp.]|nr:hypothetical protein [Candidatus Acidoferrum sp.]